MGLSCRTSGITSLGDSINWEWIVHCAINSEDYHNVLIVSRDSDFGVTYDGKGNKPDLSNTQFFLEALLAAGVSKDDPAVKNALKFISRCQNLPGETNDQPFAKKAKEKDKGGLTYTPIDPDDSKHKTPDGGLRSLGAMTYGGLKSFLYAGVAKTDAEWWEPTE